MSAEPEEEDFKEMELWEHLSELRSRLIRSVLYVLAGLVLAWILYPALYDLLFGPLKPLLGEDSGNKIVFRTVTEPFMVRLQVSLVTGLVLAIPMVTLELWGFVAPGLTRKERKAFYLVVPLSILFFFMGVVCGYFVLYPSVQWFASFIPKDVELYQSPLEFIIFAAKLVVGFGICFELPMVLMFLGYVGMVTSRGLVEHWRIAIVLCVAVGAIATPGGDPFSMVLLSMPLAVLYLASIGLVKMVEGVRARSESKGGTLPAAT